ncbi:MAG: LuxR C-terminal-related transcriptional regulator, partial [Treponema sp.]|nr:LuxR C-terminal-related transcriptional regulator [Treponema sp.]
LIHPLFLEFLATKQDLLSDEQKRETYTIAGAWCNQNGFKIDALSYYEKIQDYRSIAGIFIGSRSQIPYDIACYAAAIFERAPQEAFDTEVFLASIHMRAVMCQGRWEDAVKLAEYYEARYLQLPMDDDRKMLTLSSIYYCWGISDASMCLSNDVYDFDRHFEKLDKCISKPFDPGILINKNPGGPWICSFGSSRKGAPEEFLAAFKRSTGYLAHCYIGFETGKDELASGEILFYKDDISAAEAYMVRALDIAREKKQYGVVHRALFFILRIAVLQGNYLRIEQAFKEMKANLDKPEYFNRFIDYDITLCWYYCVLGLPEKAPDWLKESFSPYGNASFIENYANQMKARYCYMTGNYPPLLSYIHDMRQRESFLFGRVEMLAMEACSHYKMKDKKKACVVLTEAYETASPNGINMPFIEMGKDMRTLTAFVLKDSEGTIPKSWLESVSRKSASYAKHRAHVITEYKHDRGITGDIAISPRESEILTDLSHGLSRTEIASNRNLSINTIKMVVNNLYIKLGAENLADAIRIATEHKII